MLKRVVPVLLLILGLLGLFSGAGAWWLWQANRFQTDGRMVLPGLRSPVTLYRDSYGIPYLYADNLDDLYKAQGFITAQHRLSQVLFYRELVHGRLAAVVGEAALASDRRMRLFDLPAVAQRHVQALGPESLAALEAYALGFNAYITGYRHEHPLELRLLGLQATPVTVVDLLSIAHFVAFSQNNTYPASLVMQALRDLLGDAAVQRLLPAAVAHQPLPAPLSLAGGAALPDPDASPGLAAGSNAWVVAPELTVGGRAILVNDPHLDARVLPGIWHPVGLSVPGVEAIGVAIPGLPGLFVGRNQHLAFGITNSYGDMQDVYAEHVDEERRDLYLHNGSWQPFEEREEVIRVRDPAADGGFREHRMRIRSTVRGPVISDHLAVPGGRVLTLRRAAAEPSSWAAEAGFHRLWHARSVDELEDAIQRLDIFAFNVLYASRDGQYGFRASGRIPLRHDGQGIFVRAAGGEDDWLGWLPQERMPAERNPERGWVASANQDLRAQGMLEYYGFTFAPEYRSARLAQLLEQSDRHDAQGQWRIMLDIHNGHAERVRGPLLAALERLARDQPAGESVHRAAELLAGWDLRDHRDAAAPLIFQALYGAFARETFTPILGEALTQAYLRLPYLWQPALDRLLLEQALGDWHGGQGPSQQEIERRAVRAAIDGLREALGDDPTQWRWGEVHRITFVSPLRPDGWGRDWLGGGSHPYSGSGETLLRAAYHQLRPYEVQVHDSLRFLVDLAEPDRVLANLAGGVAARQFHPHFRDQLPAWLAGRPQSWGLGRELMAAVAAHRALLVPDHAVP